MNERSTADLIDDALKAQKAGRFEDAIGLYRTAAGRDDTLALDAQLQLGKLLVLLRRPDAAGVLEGAQARAEQMGELRKSVRAVYLQALLCRQNDPDAGIRLLDEHSPLNAPGMPGSQLAQWFHVRGLLEAERNNLSAAERYLFSALEYYGVVPDEAGLSEVYDSLANLLLKSGKASPALEFAQRSLKLKEKLKDLYGQAVSHGTIGRCYLVQARYLEAVAAYECDLDLARKLGDEHGVGVMLNALGEVAYLRKDFREAAHKFEENLARPDEGGPVCAALSYHGLARVYLATGDLEAASKAADALEARLARLPRPGLLEHALTGLRGAIAGRCGKHVEGEQLLDRAIEALQSHRADLDTLPFLYELRDLYQRQGKTERAVRTMSQALDLLAECGADERVSDLEEWLRSFNSAALVRLALERHFPPHLIDGILAGNLTPRLIKELTRKQTITVLFSDVRNYTTLSEGLAPERVLEILNEWFADVTRIIRQHGGVVDKFIGDAVMALFGVPDPSDEAPAAAVRTALAMREALRARNLRHRAMQDKEIHIGIGIHTGEAVVGFLGSHLRLSYTAIGDAVNIASRLESATKEYSGCDILISEATEEAQRRHGTAETEFKGSAEIKGRSAVRVYQVLGPRS